MVSKSALKRRYKKLARRESRLAINSMLQTGKAFGKSEKQRAKVNKELNKLHKKLLSKQHKRKGTSYY